MTTMSDQGSFFLVSRTWLLMLLEGAERNGITPVHMNQLHRYIYLGNVLSPVCDLTMPESYTLKHMRGPYFPRAQWDSGRLIASGFIEALNFKPFSDENGYWLSADYRITRDGLSMVEQLSSHSAFSNQVTYLREFMSACAGIPNAMLELVAEADFHYRLTHEDEVVDFSQTGGNISKQAVIEMFPDDRTYTPVEGVHRYMDYLEAASV
jgi:hypothetical protein